MAHGTGQSRYQTTLFPEALDEVIAADNEVRVVDAYVDTLDLAELGFSNVEAAAAGRPPHDPRAAAKWHLYGYPNRVRSRPRPVRETGRQVEGFWMIREVSADF